MSIVKTPEARVSSESAGLLPPGRPFRVDVGVEKYDGAVEGEPVETVTVRAGWYEADGTPITDPDRIADLDERVASREE